MLLVLVRGSAAVRAATCARERAGAGGCAQAGKWAQVRAFRRREASLPLFTNTPSRPSAFLVHPGHVGPPRRPRAPPQQPPLYRRGAGACSGAPAAAPSRRPGSGRRAHFGTRQPQPKLFMLHEAVMAHSSKYTMQSISCTCQLQLQPAFPQNMPSPAASRVDRIAAHLHCRATPRAMESRCAIT